MKANIRSEHFATAKEAVAEINAAGCRPLTLEIPPERNADHGHDFEPMVFVPEGEISTTQTGSGERCVCGPGTRIIATAGVRHRDELDGHKAVVGFSVHPSTLAQPIDEP